MKSSVSKKPAVRFPGICLVAEKLGVDRVHLYKVLTNYGRTSKRLIEKVQREPAAAVWKIEKGAAA